MTFAIHFLGIFYAYPPSCRTRSINLDNLTQRAHFDLRLPIASIE